MSTFDPNNPLTWNVPEWFNMSCYINSALWGLLYNDSFTKVIQNVDTAILTDNAVYVKDPNKCGPGVFEKLKQLLLNYKKGILDSSIQMKPQLEEIRKIFQTCSSDKTTDWNSQIGDPSIVVNIIDELFSPKSAPSNLDNFVTYNEIVKQTVSSSSKLTNNQLDLLKTFYEKGRPPAINKILYKKIATIKISKNENGYLPKIINKTNSSGIEEIFVEQISNNIESSFATTNTIGEKIDNNADLKDIDYDDRKTETETETDSSGTKIQIKKEYVYVNTKSETNSTYTLNNNFGGIIIEYSQEQSNGYGSNQQMWKILDNNIQDKYYQIGKYMLSAFACWTSPGHYTCYFRLKTDWFVMNDSGRSINKIDFKNTDDEKEFQHKLFRNSLLFFYEFNTTLTQADNKYCSDVFNYNISDETSKLAPAPRSSSSSSSSAPRSSSSLSGSVKRTPNPAPKNTVQIPNKCEKYGEEWLDLFIDENAVPGTSVSRNGRLASYKSKKTGTKTTVMVPQQCLAPQSGQPGTNLASSTQPQTGSQVIPTTPVLLPKITVDKLKVELNEKMKPAFNAILTRLNTKNIQTINSTIIDINNYIAQFQEYITDNKPNLTNSTTDEKDKLEININIQAFLMIITELTKLQDIFKKLNPDASNIQEVEDEVTTLQTSLSEDVYLSNLIGAQQQLTSTQSQQTVNQAPVATPTNQGPVVTPTEQEILNEEADKALEESKKLIIKNQAVSERVKNAVKGDDNDISAYPSTENPKPTAESLNQHGNLIYFNQNVYVAGFFDSEPDDIKLYNVSDNGNLNSICDLDGKNCIAYNDDPFTLFTYENQTIAQGNKALEEAKNALKIDKKKIPLDVLTELDTKTNIDSFFYKKNLVPRLSDAISGTIVYDATNKILYMVVNGYDDKGKKNQNPRKNYYLNLQKKNKFFSKIS
jgi:hypothetical protein